jgi:hypothetical protein
MGFDAAVGVRSQVGTALCTGKVGLASVMWWKLSGQDLPVVEYLIGFLFPTLWQRRRTSLKCHLVHKLHPCAL